MWVKTTGGYVLGFFTILLGVIMLAVPISVFSANFKSAHDANEQRKRIAAQVEV